MLFRLVAPGVALVLLLSVPDVALARAGRGAALAPLPGLPCQAADPAAACPAAQPRQHRGTLKVRERMSRGARSLGDVRPEGAVTVVAAEGGGGGCSRWLRAHPVGFVCLEEVSLGPGPVPAARVKPPPRYAVVRSAKAPARDARDGAPSDALQRGDGVTLVPGQDLQRQLLRVTAKKLLRRDDLTVAEPSRLRGRDLRAVPAAQRYTLAFLVPPGGGAEALLHPPGSLLAAAGAGTGKDRSQAPLGLPGGARLPRYAALWLTGAPAAPGRVAVRVASDNDKDDKGVVGEVDEALLRRVLPAPPPAGLRDSERWIDVSLSQQVAVAYQGRDPVFATLVSTAKHGTPSGTFYIQRKYRTQTMQNRADAQARYDFRDVPAAQFYDGRFGLHAALWHDRLGEPVSHGCVNLSPADADVLFTFTEPALPPGWHAIRGQPALPASRIVVRP